MFFDHDYMIRRARRIPILTKSMFFSFTLGMKPTRISPFMINLHRRPIIKLARIRSRNRVRNRTRDLMTHSLKSSLTSSTIILIIIIIIWVGNTSERSHIWTFQNSSKNIFSKTIPNHSTKRTTVSDLVHSHSLETSSFFAIFEYDILNPNVHMSCFIVRVNSNEPTGNQLRRFWYWETQHGFCIPFCPAVIGHGGILNGFGVSNCWLFRSCSMEAYMLKEAYL